MKKKAGQALTAGSVMATMKSAKKASKSATTPPVEAAQSPTEQMAVPRQKEPSDEEIAKASGVDVETVKVFRKHDKATQAVRLFGFQPVKARQEGRMLDFLCRTALEPDILFARVQTLLLDQASVDIGKRYVIKDGRLAHGWYIRFSVDAAPQVLAEVTRLREVYETRPKTPALRGGNPTGVILRQGAPTPEPGSGMGVAPSFPLGRIA